MKAKLPLIIASIWSVVILSLLFFFPVMHEDKAVSLQEKFLSKQYKEVRSSFDAGNKIACFDYVVKKFRHNHQVVIVNEVFVLDKENSSILDNPSFNSFDEKISYNNRLFYINECLPYSEKINFHQADYFRTIKHSKFIVPRYDLEVYAEEHGLYGDGYYKGIQGGKN